MSIECPENSAAQASEISDAGDTAKVGEEAEKAGHTGHILTSVPSKSSSTAECSVLDDVLQAFSAKLNITASARMPAGANGDVSPEGRVISWELNGAWEWVDAV